jgi:hypothetical protein
MGKKKPSAAEEPSSTTPPEVAPEPGSVRSKRAALIHDIERERGSRVIAYICSDRPGASGQIGEDAVGTMYDHLRPIGKVEAIDLYLYSRGGAVEVPWRIVSMLREHCSKLGVLIPYRAQSAATLIALGCDEIVMGSKAELGPIDPALTGGRLTIDNAPAEQAIRPLAVGRRNWLHIGGNGGLQPTAVLLSVTASVKRHGVTPGYTSSMF